MTQINAILKQSFLAKGLVAVFAVMFLSVAQAQMKIGVVNMGRIMKEAPQAAQFKSQMDANFGSRRDSLEAQADKLQQDVEAYKKNSAVMGEAERLTQQTELRKREIQLKDQMIALRDEFARKERELTRSLTNEIKAKIDSFAASQGYDLILMDAGLAFYGPQYDVTTELLTVLSQ